MDVALAISGDVKATSLSILGSDNTGCIAQTWPVLTVVYRSLLACTDNVDSW